MRTFYYSLFLIFINCYSYQCISGKIDLVFIGTGAGGSSKMRGSTSTAMRLVDGEIWMFDCGEGTNLKMNEALIKPSRISAVFITHLHGDHVWGLPSFLCSHWTTNDTMQKRGKYGFHIFGPRGIRKMIRSQLLLSRSLCMFYFTIHELIPQESQYECKEEHDYYKNVEKADGPLHPQEILGQDIEAHIGPDGNPVWHLVNDTRGVLVAGKILHRLPTFGYTFSETCSIMNLNTQLLMTKYNLTPGIEYGILQRGLKVHLPNNITIHPQEVILKRNTGRKITILGDTSNPWPMFDIARGSDVLVHEATHLKYQSEAADFYAHSTPSMAVRFAKSICARIVVLNHISQRVHTKLNFKSKYYENKSISTDDDVLKEAVEELFKYRNRNLSIIIADDSAVLSIDKKSIDHGHYGMARPSFHLTRVRKFLPIYRSVYEPIQYVYTKPPNEYKNKFKLKTNTFLPPLHMLSNFSRHKFKKYYNFSNALVDSLIKMPKPDRFMTKKPFYKCIQNNFNETMNQKLLNVVSNRTFINLEPLYVSNRIWGSRYYFNKTISSKYYDKYGNQSEMYERVMKL